jgi:hypothetical protein
MPDEDSAGRVHASCIEAATSRFSDHDSAGVGLGWYQERRVVIARRKPIRRFITTDKNLRYQQNLSGRKLAIIELPTNEVPIVVSLAASILEALADINAGDFVEIPLP